MTGSEIVKRVQLFGGPLDGATVDAPEPKKDLELLRITDEAGRLSDETYLARDVEGIWFGVHSDLLQEYVRSDEVHIKDPDPGEIRARIQAQFGGEVEFLIPICTPGTHRWSDWRLTPGGNRTRMCVICMTSQGAIL